MKKHDRYENNPGVTESGDPYGDLLILYIEKHRPADLPIAGKETPTGEGQINSRIGVLRENKNAQPKGEQRCK
jgi:hypothetical protein